MISAKVASLNDDSSRNNEDNNCWREVRRKNRGSATMKQNAYVIPTIINRCQLPNFEESKYKISEGRSEFHRIPTKGRGKTTKCRKETHKVILLADSHARNITR
jgi:hypothetical protein